jgi:hypothetical protein
MMSVPQDKRVWLGGGAFVAVLIAVVSWFMVISPELSSATSLRSQATDADFQNSLTQAKVSKLKLQADHPGKLTTSLQTALNALPKASGLPAFTRQLNAQATGTDVRVVSIVIGAIAIANATAPAATAPDATAPAAAPGATAGPASAAGSVFAIPVTVVSTGDLIPQLRFLKSIQGLGPRRALVTSTQFAPAGNVQTASVDRAAKLTVQLTVFSAP